MGLVYCVMCPFTSQLLLVLLTVPAWLYSLMVCPLEDGYPSQCCPGLTYSNIIDCDHCATITPNCHPVLHVYVIKCEWLAMLSLKFVCIILWKYFTHVIHRLGHICHYTVVMLLTFTYFIVSIPSSPHSFIPGLKPPFSANSSHRSLHFLLRDCLLILLSISVYYFLVFPFSTF